MKIKRSDLLDCLRYVEPVLKTRTTLPVLSMVRMGATGGVLTVEAFSLEVYAKATVACDGDLPPCCVLSRKLTPLLVADAVELTGTDGWLAVSAGGRSKVPTLAGDKFEEFNCGPAEVLLEDCGPLAAAFDTAGYAVSAETFRGALQYVHVGPSYVESADGRRLVRSDVDMTLGRDLFVNPSFASYLAGRLSVSKNWLICETEGRYTASKLPEWTYPVYGAHVTEERSLVGSVTREQLLSTLAPVSSMVSDKFSGVRLDVSGTALRFSAESENGETEFEIEGAFTVAKDAAIKFSPVALVEAVTKMEDGAIEIYMTEKIAPLKLKQGNTAAFISPMCL